MLSPSRLLDHKISISDSASEILEQWIQSLIHQLMDLVVQMPPRKCITQDKIRQVLPEFLSTFDPVFSDHVLERLRYELEE